MYIIMYAEYSRSEMYRLYSHSNLPFFKGPAPTRVALCRYEQLSTIINDNLQRILSRSPLPGSRHPQSNTTTRVQQFRKRTPQLPCQ